MPAVAQRVSALERLMASIFSGAIRTSKARVNRAVKLKKGSAGKCAPRAQTAVKRTFTRAGRNVAS